MIADNEIGMKEGKAEVCGAMNESDSVNLCDSSYHYCNCID